MNLIVVHDKNKSLLKYDMSKLDEIQNEIDEVITWTEIKDKGIKKWCDDNSIRLKCYTAKWQRLGRKAGLDRNTHMVNYADSMFMAYHKDKSFFALRKVALLSSLTIIK